jgi:hypothetical protein
MNQKKYYIIYIMCGLLSIFCANTNPGEHSATLINEFNKHENILKKIITRFKANVDAGIEIYYDPKGHIFKYVNENKLKIGGLIVCIAIQNERVYNKLANLCEKP